MNYLSIITALLFIFCLSACTSDADFLIEKNGVAEGGESLITFSVLAPAETKSLANDKSVSHCSVLLLNANGLVIAAQDHVAEINGALDVRFLIKAQSGLKVVVIANSALTFAHLSYYSDIKNQIQQEADLSSLAKMGESDVILSYSSASTSDAMAHPNKVQVSLHQLAARIELAGFNITVDKSVHPDFSSDVVLESVSLKHAAIQAATSLDNASIYATPATTDFTQLLQTVVYDGQKGAVALPENKQPYFYSFPSQNADLPVMMELCYRIGNDRHVKCYPIKHSMNEEKVLSGYLYRLTVNLTINKFDVTSSVEYSAVSFEQITIDIPAFE